MFKEKWLKIAYTIILGLIIIFLAGRIPYFMEPLTTVLSFIMLPLLFSIFLYYLLRPLVNILEEKLKIRTIAVIISFLAAVSIITIIIYLGGNIIYEQSRELGGRYELVYSSLVEIFENIRDFINIEREIIDDFNLRERLIAYTDSIIMRLSTYNYMGIFSSLTNIGLIILLIPFVLFYLLKDDKKIYQKTIEMIPESKRSQVEELAQDIDKLLSDFITSQLLVSLFTAFVMLIGFLIIRLASPLVLALIVFITSLIPIIGPAIGILPALFLALTESIITALMVIIIFIIAQYLEGNLIRPLIQGKSMDIHPLVVLFVVLTGVYLFGLIGALISVPLYAVLRLIYQERILKKK